MLKFLKSRLQAAALFLLLVFVGAPGDASPSTSAQQNSDDIAAKVICNVVVFVQRLGLPIMTGVILGASIMAIFGKMAWASIVVLVVFTAIFFGAGKLMQKFAAGLNNEFGDAKTFECKGKGETKMPASK
ncbi:TrbC/VirB2 family protein [Anaplasma platys]|uniref:TrbC/VirB2 family protein n=1 Tax=Anaplasma platys TaxID=949 RepID=UPI00145E5378|nr:TrbC/VirB2 family protein [Anaplasma platys]